MEDGDIIVIPNEPTPNQKRLDERAQVLGFKDNTEILKTPVHERKEAVQGYVNQGRIDQIAKLPEYIQNSIHAWIADKGYPADILQHDSTQGNALQTEIHRVTKILEGRNETATTTVDHAEEKRIATAQNYMKQLGTQPAPVQSAVLGWVKSIREDGNIAQLTLAELASLATQIKAIKKEYSDSLAAAKQAEEELAAAKIQQDAKAAEVSKAADEAKDKYEKADPATAYKPIATAVPSDSEDFLALTGDNPFEDE
jgi:hypothetical protein